MTTTAALTQGCALFLVLCLSLDFATSGVVELQEKFFSPEALSHGVSAASLDRVKERGWMTVGAFAFSSSSPPGGSVERDLFWKEVEEQIFKDPASLELSGLRRQHCEAWRDEVPT